jgi:hypothetical protein
MIHAARMLPGKVVDTAGQLTPKLVAAVKAAGYQGIVRYVPHVGAAGKGDITASEAATICAGTGLGLLLVQHVRLPNWNPINCSGHNDGMAAASRAFGIGYPHGAHLFVDLEGIAGPGAATTVYAEAWAQAVVDAGYRAGAYVGYAVPLTAVELYNLHNITSYWCDAGPRQVATRGFSMKQHSEVTIGGMLFDPDDVFADGKGETPAWMMG